MHDRLEEAAGCRRAQRRFPQLPRPRQGGGRAGAGRSDSDPPHVSDSLGSPGRECEGKDEDRGLDIRALSNDSADKRGRIRDVESHLVCPQGFVREPPGRRLASRRCLPATGDGVAVWIDGIPLRITLLRGIAEIQAANGP